MNDAAKPLPIKQAIQLLEAIVADRTLLASLEEDERIALLRAAGLVANPERDAVSRLTKAVRRQRRQVKQEKDREARASSGIRALRLEPVFAAPQLSASRGSAQVPPASQGPERVLERPKGCYVCKAEFRHLHHFYDSMCIPCGDLNYAKRFARAPLEGKTALLTGARVKIGYQASLMLLRSGARVIATTRFPKDAAVRYCREPDAQSWLHRLHIHGLDLRHAPSVELFARYIGQTHARLDILINNAAQTVRRPPGFYGHLLSGETRPWSELSEQERILLSDHQACLASIQEVAGESSSADIASALAPAWRSGDPTLGLRVSAALSQVPYAFEPEGDVQALFPQGKLDADLQQIDLRGINSWRLTLSQVETAEMLEVHLVNAVAPFILCGKLKPLMLRDREKAGPGHVVNVSAMEGSFSRGTKTDKHPHTNMAKAALNMMTLTSAPEYARDGIFMNATDTGWVTDEDPAVHANRKRDELDFQPPLDIVDGAARVVDPIFSAIQTGQYVWGNFFKDYRPTAW